jgi:hypothetical protein
MIMQAPLAFYAHAAVQSWSFGRHGLADLFSIGVCADTAAPANQWDRPGEKRLLRET